MYLEGRRDFYKNYKNPEIDPTEEGYRIKSKIYDLGYWRKHPNLHGYIVQTFADGVDDCQEIPLSQQDLIKMIAAVKDGNLPHTTGFFFGESSGDDDERQEDLAILTKALIWLQSKEDNDYRSVIYRSSW
jgi:hypothetical protein